MQGDPIQDYRVAIVRGRVLDSARQPLAGVLVRALNQRESGYTYSRSSGYYDLVLNGSGDVILDYFKPGLLTSQRRKLAEWRDFSLFPDVVLIAPGAEVTPVMLGTAAPAQFASGSSQTDQDGSRTSRVYFPSGTTANLIYANGPTEAMPQLMESIAQPCFDEWENNGKPGPDSKGMRDPRGKGFKGPNERRGNIRPVPIPTFLLLIDELI